MTFDRARRGWLGALSSFAARVARVRDKGFQIVQCALAAGIAWWIAHDLVGHTSPFFAPVAAVLSLGTSYGQRRRRVLEVTLGVAVGVLIGDWIVLSIGSGWWQLALIVASAMAVAVAIDGGQLFVAQAAVQGIVVVALLPDSGESFVRWTDVLIGGAVALVAATVVPGAPLRKPRDYAARVLRKEAELLGEVAAMLRESSLPGTGEPIPGSRLERALDSLADARATDYLVQELTAAADEGLDVVRTSPFRRGRRPDLRYLVDLVEPLDRSLRSTRVLVRQTVAAVRHQARVPESYADLCERLARAAHSVADEVADTHGMGGDGGARTMLRSAAAATGAVERSPDLAAEAILAQLRSITVDLLMVTGLDQFESTDTLPPPPR
ncbi:MAG: FUSC family protein [Nocardioides sp.]